MKTFDIWVSKKWTFFVLKHVKCVYKDDVSTTINISLIVFWFVDFVDFVPACAQLFICHAAFNSAFYTGNAKFESDKIVLF